MRKHLSGVVRQTAADDDNGYAVCAGKTGDPRRCLAECRLKIHPALAGKNQLSGVQMGLNGRCLADDLYTALELRSGKHKQPGA